MTAQNNDDNRVYRSVPAIFGAALNSSTQRDEDEHHNDLENEEGGVYLEEGG